MSTSSASNATTGAAVHPAPTTGKKPGGGTATGGGINFQAAMTAIAGAHLLRGVPLGWLPVPDVVGAVWAESEGAGDDLRLEISAGVVAEVQAKKGLARSGELWDALEALVDAIKTGDLQYGVLAVAPDSSGTVKDDLPKDLERLGEGRADNLTDICAELHRRLQALGGNWQQACQRLRIRVVHALTADDAGVGLAKECLRWVCADECQADTAWNALYRDAVRLIETRGRWTTHQLLRLLQREGIAVRDAEFPAALSAKLARWVASKYCDFGLPATRKRLPMSALIEMDVVAATVDQPDAVDAAAALSRYRGVSGAESRASRFDALWTGRFKRQAVVVAGPGLGKSTLVKLLAGQYASDGFPVLCVALKSVAAAVERGDSFDIALARHALDGSGIKPELLDTSKLEDLVVLADGLDECGANHGAVAEALSAFCKGHPSARIVVTTRPIGYTTSALSAWTHYRLLAPEVSDGPRNLAGLLQALFGEDSSDWRGIARRELSESKAKEAISASPHLLCMAAALIATKGHLPDTKTKLYASLLALYEDSVDKRIAPPAPAPIATRVLNAMGWQLGRTPIATAAHIVEGCAELLATPLGRTPLAAMEVIDPVVRYWERLGVIEQLYHDGVAYWAFVHKTFGEYAAARFLADLPAETQKVELRTRMDAPEWHEVMLFAAGLGLGDEVIDVLVEAGDSTSFSRLVRALALAGNPDANVSESSAGRLVALAFVIMTTVDRMEAFSIGERIAELADVKPEAVSKSATAGLASDSEPILLTAWACEVVVNPYGRSAAELTAVLDRFLPMLKPGIGVSLFGKLILGRHGDRGLAARVALAALALHGDTECRELAAKLLVSGAFQTQTFFDQVDALLKARGIPRIEPPWLNRSQAVARMVRDVSWIQEAGRAWRAIVEAVSEHPDSSPGVVKAEPFQRWFPQFGALGTLIGFRDVPSSDMHAWDKPYNKEVLRAIIQAVIHASAIDADEIAQEALLISAKHRSDEELGRFHVDSPRVDVPALDWKKAASIVGSRATLVAGLSHGSVLMAYVAGNMLAEMDSTRDEAAAVLATVRGAGLWGAVEIVRAQHPASANELILKALVDPLPEGAEHLFKGLVGHQAQASTALHEAIRLGLASQQSEVARAAADLAKDVTGRAILVDPAVVWLAYADWKGREPRERKSFDPPSPRAALLEVLVALGTTSDDFLLEALSDQRIDVKEVARECLLRQLQAAESLRQEVVARAAARSIAPSMVADILESEPPFLAEQVQSLVQLLGDGDPEWRLAGLELLRPVYLNQETIDCHIARLSVDAEHEIRRKAAGIKAKLPEQESGAPRN